MTPANHDTPSMTFAITGALGQTGSAASSALLAAGARVRMVVRRDDAQAAAWRQRGAEVVVADLRDAGALAQAFAGVHGAYLMNPPAYHAADVFAAAREVHEALVQAARTAGVRHVVALSSVGAQHASGTGNIFTTHDLERRVAGLPCGVTILRAANFMENWAWSFREILAEGVLHSMFKPLGRALPMVSAADIGRTAAGLLLAGGQGLHTVELHGPADVSPIDAAGTLSRLLGRKVRAAEADEARWAGHLRQAGFPSATVEAFVEMFHGFNEGHVAFEGVADTRRGTVTLASALQACLSQAEAAKAHA